MKYMLLIYANQAEMPRVTPEDQAAWQSMLQEAQAAGVLLYNDGLAPAASATTVRIRSGKTILGDGPYAETHEQLGGCCMLNCKDLDEAIAWATKIPGAKFGTIEIRPVNIWTIQRDERASNG